MKTIQKSTKPKYHPQLISHYLLITILLLLSFTLPAQEWTEPLNITNLGGYSMDPDMVFDHNGVIHVVWSYKIEDNYWKVMYAYSEDNGQSWSEALDLIQNTELWMSQPHIACDSKNNLYVTYDYNTGYPAMMMVYIMIFNGSQWSQPILVSESMYGSSYNKMIMDNNNQLILGWYKNGKFYYRFFENSIFSEIYCPYCYEEDKYLPVEGALNTNKEIHWIGSSASANYYGERLQYYLHNISLNSWTEPQMPVEDTITVGKDIALNNDDIPESAYRTYPSPNDETMHIIKEGNYWSNPDLVAGTYGTQKYQQIAVDQYNDVHIVEQQKTADGYGLTHYKKKDDTWVGQFIDTCYIVNFPKLIFKNNKLYCVYSKTWVVENEFESDIFFSLYDIITGLDYPKREESIKIYPNPSRQNINIEIRNNKRKHINLSIFDINGKKIKTLVSETKPRGVYRHIWKGTDKYGKEVKNGLYLVRLQSGRNTLTRTVEVLK